jgi:hypothetical protein
MLERRGPVLAALLAAAAALPALWMPFLADDWANLEWVTRDIFGPTPFAYVRPLYLASFRLEWWLWGAAPAMFHLTNVVLISATAALVVVVVRRYTRDAFLAGLAGVLFALHPYHVENAAWVAGRSDTMFALLYVAAALTWDRWRVAARGLPVLTLALFAGALLSKESAVTFPIFVLLVGYLDRSRRPSRAEWLRGYVPMVAMALIWFLALRPMALGDAGFRPLGHFGLRWAAKLAAFGAAGLLPAHTEILEAHPAAWAAASAVLGAVLLAGAIRGAGRIPKVVWACVPAFIILLGASLLSFQERYFFLPGAAAAVALAALLRAAGPRIGSTIGLLILSGWIVSAADHWIGWRAAAVTSRALVKDLVRASHDPGTREVVLVNAPHRVHGAPVYGRLQAAVALSGGRAITITSATLIDYATPDTVALDGATGDAVRGTEVVLRIRDEAYSRYVFPRNPPGADRIVTETATIWFDGSERVIVRVDPDPGTGRAAYYWSAGHLERLFRTAGS